MLGARNSARPKLVEPSGFDTPERAELALAVAAHKALSDGAAKMRIAGAELQARVTATKEARWAADAAVAKAIEDGPAYLAAKITGNEWQGEPPLSVKDARAALVEATDAEQEAIEAARLLAPELDRAAANPDHASRRSLQAARAVLRSEAGITAVNVAATVQRLRSELAMQTALLRWMADNGLFPVKTDIGYGHGQPLDPAVRRAVAGETIEQIDVKVAEVCAPWRDALAALQEDAAAPVPT